MFNETAKVINYVMKYPNLFIQKIIEDSYTEQYANVAFNVILGMFILVMFFFLFIVIILILKGCWIMLKGICFWFFSRDTLKEFLIKQKEDDREFLKQLFKHFEDEMKKAINK